MTAASNNPLFYFQQVWRRWKDFEGRSTRSEYWWFLLCNIIVGLALLAVGHAIGVGDTLRLIYAVICFIPALAVTVRRLHDTDRSGWWILIGFVPLVGLIVLLVFYCQDSTPGANRFGANPKPLYAPPPFQG